MGMSAVRRAQYNTSILKCPHSIELHQTSRNSLRDDDFLCRAGIHRCDDLNRFGTNLHSHRQLTDQIAVALYG